MDCEGGDGEEAELEGEERLCVECSPRSGRLCSDGRHSASYVWKCRLCCRVADVVCHGGVHLCERCHGRQGVEDERRVRDLEGEECLGAGRCVLGGLSEGERHRNGGGVNCELLLGCAVCDSEGGGLGREERGSANLVRNGSGEENMEGWVALSYKRWKVERSELPLRAGVNFVSGHDWCKMAQVVDLERFVQRPGEAFVEVGARYMARTDCPSVFRMEAWLFDESGAKVGWWNSGVLDAPPDGWERARFVFAPVAGARFVLVIVCGKDSRFWAGEYGAKVAEVSVRILFDGSVGGEWEGVLREGAFDRPLGVNREAEKFVVNAYLVERMEQQRMEEGRWRTESLGRRMDEERSMAEEFTRMRGRRNRVRPRRGNN